MDEGTDLVGKAGTTMDEIVFSVKRVTDIMGEITAATHEQTGGIEQVNQAIAQIDEVTQQNAALVEEASAAAQAMQDQAKHLMGAVAVFKLDSGHAGAAEAVSKAWAGDGKTCAPRRGLCTGAGLASISRLA